MCQTAIITKNISSLGKRTFEQRMSLDNVNFNKSRKLSLLNKGLDLLYQMLYDQFDSISFDDYIVFGNKLDLLLETINSYLMSLKKLNITGIEIDKLDSNYSALYEINADIKNYKVNSVAEADFQNLLSNLPIF